MALARQDRWEHAYPSYPDDMLERAGRIGKVVPSEAIDPPEEVFLVEFDEAAGDSWYYKEEWLRAATPKEIRAYKFTRDVKRM